MRIYQSRLMAAMALGGLLACAAVCSAQSTNAPTRGANRDFVKQRVERMSSDLNLTSDQKTKVTALLQEDTKKRQELRADTSIPREQKREKGQALMAEQEKKLKEILTPDQYDKWQKMRQQFRPRRSEGQAPDKKAQ